MQSLILAIHVLVAITLIVLVLMQHGKGADVGASFGSGASQTIFGSQGSASFLVKLTSIMAFIFFTTCLLLGFFTAQEYKRSKQESIIMSVGDHSPASIDNQDSTSSPASPVSKR